VIGCNLQLHE